MEARLRSLAPPEILVDIFHCSRFTRDHSMWLLGILLLVAVLPFNIVGVPMHKYFKPSGDLMQLKLLAFINSVHVISST